MRLFAVVFLKAYLVCSTLVYVCVGFSLRPSVRIRTPAFCRSSSTAVWDSASTSSSYETWKTLLEHFSGDFDNYYQVYEDRQENLLPREGGGHEHIHCTLIPVSDKNDDDEQTDVSLGPTETSARLAAFYFEGMPERIFRFRHYRILLTDSNDSSVDMILHTLHPDLEAKLRHAPNPMQWPRIFHEFQSGTPQEPTLKQLPRCEVRWSRDMDPVLHEYALQHPLAHSHGRQNQPEADQHHAVMVHGQAIVNSTMVPGTEILIKDQLSLWSDDFWIHDRGYNVATGEFIYGNQRNVPYQLRRVTEMRQNGQRTVVNAQLEWTLGPDWRTQDEYERRMARIGGVSTRMNAPPSKRS